MPRTLPPRVLRFVRLPAGTLERAAAGARALSWLGDAAAIAVLLVAALSTAWPLLRAADLDTGSGDWHAHAFRVQELGARGLATWTHEWAGGLPLWSSYQFVPHALTWALSAVTGASVTRTMAVLVGTLAVWLPLNLYLVLRVAGTRALPALTGGLLALALDTRRQALANFSELWGLALAPLLLWAAYRWSGRHGAYGVAFACGLAVYVHPLAAAVGVIGLCAAALTRFPVLPRRAQRPVAPAPDSTPSLRVARWLRFSAPPRAGTVLRWGSAVLAWLIALLLQLGIAAGAAAFFLVPAVRAARPAYEDPYFTSAGFERLLARLASASFVTGWPVWLALSAGGALLVLGWGRLSLPPHLRGRVRPHLANRLDSVGGRLFSRVPVSVRVRWDDLRRRTAGLLAWPREAHPVAADAVAEHRRAAVFLLWVAGIVVLVTVTSVAGMGPRLYLGAQLPRLLSLLPLLAAAGVALALNFWLIRVRTFRNGGLAATALSTMIAIVAGMVVVARGGLPQAVTAQEEGPRSSFTRWLLSTHEVVPAGNRVSAPPVLVADASAFARGRVWYTGSYSGREWSILGGPLAAYMAGFGAPETRGAFLTAMAVDLAVVPAGDRPVILDPATWQPVEWQVMAELGDVDVLRLPWRAPYAVTVPRGADDGLDVPDLRFLTVEESFIRDELTRRWAALGRGPDAIPTLLRVRPGGAVDFELRQLPPGRELLVSENWDRSWRAEAGGRRLPVRRAGPNLIAIDLADAPSAVAGDVHVRLTHEVPREWVLGILALLLTVPVTAAAIGWGPTLRDG